MASEKKGERMLLQTMKILIEKIKMHCAHRGQSVSQLLMSLNALRIIDGEKNNKTKRNQTKMRENKRKKPQRKYMLSLRFII